VPAGADRIVDTFADVPGAVAHLFSERTAS